MMKKTNIKYLKLMSNMNCC